MHRRSVGLNRNLIGSVIAVVGVIAIDGRVLALGNWGPLVKDKMGNVITVSGTVGGMNLSVMVVRVIGGGVRCCCTTTTTTTRRGR